MFIGFNQLLVGISTANLEVLEFEKVYSEDPVRQFIKGYVMLSVAKKVKEVILTNTSTITRNGDNNTEFPKGRAAEPYQEWLDCWLDCKRV